MSRQNRLAAVGVLLTAALAAAGCDGDTSDTVDVGPRPVLTAVAQTTEATSNGYVGTVEPRFSTELGFRVLGRLIARNVDVGDRVTRGETLALIDASTLEFALEAAKAQVTSAEAQSANAQATEIRQRTLQERGVASQAQLDAALQARDSADAQLRQAQADLAKAREQLGYARLKASFDGVVTATGADVGQVVTPGETVVTLARLDQREAVVDIPESQDKPASVDGFSKGARFVVTLQAFPAEPVDGTVREIAPQADEATRTRRVRISLQKPGPNFRLGATVMARPLETGPATIALPASAILDENGKTAVWVVKADPLRVVKTPVTIAARAGASVRLAGGIAPGTRVVTAGVHSLEDGQAVTLYGETGE